MRLAHMAKVGALRPTHRRQVRADARFHENDGSGAGRVGSRYVGDHRDEVVSLCQRREVLERPVPKRRAGLAAPQPTRVFDLVVVPLTRIHQDFAIAGPDPITKVDPRRVPLFGQMLDRAADEVESVTVP